jgi:hypothetical protein
MPTLPQKLEAIRQACVRANPDRYQFGIPCPLVLSDILLAYDKAGKLSWSKDKYGIVNLGHDATELIINWRLGRPSLDDQEEPTVNLIYEILCAQ